MTLQGRAGDELRLIANAPLLIDLADFQTPLANVRANGDALIRVGLGVGTVRVSVPSARRALILARNAPNLRVELADGRQLLTPAELVTSAVMGTSRAQRARLAAFHFSTQLSSPLTTSPLTSSRGWFRWLYTIVSGLMPTEW